MSLTNYSVPLAFLRQLSDFLGKVQDAQVAGAIFPTPSELAEEANVLQYKIDMGIIQEQDTEEMILVPKATLDQIHQALDDVLALVGPPKPPETSIESQVYIDGGPRALREYRKDQERVRQTTCKHCGLDIEGFAPFNRATWRDRGNNTHCANGAVHSPVLPL